MDIQTPAEKFLIGALADFVNNYSGTPVMLNVGAGKSLLIENSLTQKTGRPFLIDRFDVAPPGGGHGVVRKHFIASVENIAGAARGEYDAAFANYVFEHVENMPAAAKELARVLKPGAPLIISTPNPRAPEFILSHHTPHRFHQWIKGEGDEHLAHPAHYGYKSVKEMEDIFAAAGFKPEREEWRAFTFGYLYRFPVIGWLSRAYDALVNLLGLKILMGNVLVIFKKI